MGFLCAMAQVLRLALVSLLALGLAAFGLLAGMAVAASLVAAAAIQRIRARRAGATSAAGRGRPLRSAARATQRLDVVDVEFREKRWSDGHVGSA